MILYSLILSLVLLDPASAQTKNASLPSIQEQQIMEISLNNQRSLVSNASNMLAVKWNDTIAKEAQRLVDAQSKCYGSFSDAINATKFGGWSFYGSKLNPYPPDIVNSALGLFRSKLYGGSKSYGVPGKSCSCPEYEQMIDAGVDQFGCVEINCFIDSSVTQQVTCLFNHKLPASTLPGPRCSNCPTGTVCNSMKLCEKAGPTTRPPTSTPQTCQKTCPTCQNTCPTCPTARSKGDSVRHSRWLSASLLLVAMSFVRWLE